MQNYFQSFFWGIISAGFALVGQVLLIIFTGDNFTFDNLTTASLLSLAFFILIEELSKYLILIKKIIPASISLRNILLNSWFAGMGFSVVELFIIYQKKLLDNVALGEFDLAKIGLLHIFIFGFLGYSLATAKSLSSIFKVIIFVFAVHFVYNFSILYLNRLGYFVEIILITLLFIINISIYFIVNKKLASV